LTDSHDQLIRRCLSGEETAIRELVERYQSLVFAVCFRMMGQREDAEDAAQETLIRAVRSLATYDRTRAFEPWLLTIAANRCRTALGVRGRRREGSELHDGFADPSGDVLSARHLEEEVACALETMRAEYRTALVLFHEQERSYLEMSEILGRPVGTIKTWVHRARQELLQHLRSRGILQESTCGL
jgi:RNA polymerase sigma-70 factor (ECF subfamily)